MEGSPDRGRLALAARATWLNALALSLAIGGAVALAVVALTLPGRPAWGFDFAAYYQAATRLLNTGSPYDPATLAQTFELGPAGLYVYSPPLAQLVTPLAVLDQGTATMAWFALRVALLVALCLIMPVPWRVRAAIFGVAALSAPVLGDLVLGNVSLVITSLTVIAWRFLDRPLAGVAISVSLFLRPTMGLLLVWWLVRRRASPLVGALAGGVAIGLISIALVTVQPYLDYVRLTGNIGAATGVLNNLDLASWATRLGAPELAWPALAISFALALGAGAASLRRDRELSFVVVSMAVLFVSPLLWGHYLTQLLVPTAFLAARGRWWALGLPLLAWLPPIALPLVGLAGMLLPLLAPDRGEPALGGGWPGLLSARRPRRLSAATRQSV